MIDILGNIVVIKSGVFAKTNANPDLYCIQSTDFNKQREWVDNVAPTLANEYKFARHLLRRGDILFAAKGRDLFAVVYDGAYAPAVASTTFLVLQLNSNRVLSEYVAWYLNHPTTQKLIASFARGTAITSINKSALELLEISIPDMSKQNTILEFSKLQKKERQLQKQLLKLKQHYLNELTYKSIQ